MSIFNDDRIISDDIWAYTEWLNEVKRECRGDNDYPLVIDTEGEYDETGEVENDKRTSDSDYPQRVSVRR